MNPFLKILSYVVLCTVSSLYSSVLYCQQADSLFQKFEDYGYYFLSRDQDTNYISNYWDEVSLRLVAVNKYNYFRLRDREYSTRIRYRPVRDISLGLGVSYRWFALDITFSLGLRDLSEFENTRSFDFQGRLFTSKQYISATVQYYQAYKMGSSGGLKTEVNEGSKRREDIRTMNFGLQYLLAINYTRFSLKAPFVFNEIQKKSAGSPIIGASFGMFSMDADSSIVPPEIRSSFSPSLYIHNMGIITAAISLGYMYTFVYKNHYFITLGLIPGINVNGGDYNNETREYIGLNVNGEIYSMNAVGYNGRRFHAGINLTINSYFSRLEKNLFAEIGHGRFTIFAGYRFKRRK